MKLTARQRLLGGALLLAGAVWGFDALTGGGRPAPAAAQPAATPAVPAGPGWEAVDEQLQRLVRREYEGVPDAQQMNRDLFRPTATMEAAYPAPVEEAPLPDELPPEASEEVADDFDVRHQLVAVMRGATPLAVVDGQLVPLHAEFDGYRLVAVHRDRAVFRDPATGREVELLLAPRPGKTP